MLSKSLSISFWMECCFSSIGWILEIAKLYNICQNVTQSSMPEIPETVMGWADKPLFDAVPVCTYIHNGHW
jgi:hypothetical protein